MPSKELLWRKGGTLASRSLLRKLLLAVFSEVRLVKKFGQKGFAQICKHLIPIADEFLDVRVVH
jgi:hypothetical protein